MPQSVKVWFDLEGDFLEVLFSDQPGYMQETAHDAVMERIDADDNLLGFSILGVSQLAKEQPLIAELAVQQGESQFQNQAKAT